MACEVADNVTWRPPPKGFARSRKEERVGESRAFGQVFSNRFPFRSKCLQPSMGFLWNSVGG